MRGLTVNLQKDCACVRSKFFHLIHKMNVDWFLCFWSSSLQCLNFALNHFIIPWYVCNLCFSYKKKMLLLAAGANFTLVIIGLYNTTSYADMRIIGPGMQLALAEVRQTYPSLNNFHVEIWKEPFQNDCDNLEFNVANMAAKSYYSKLNSSHPISAFLGTTCSFSDNQVLNLLYCKFFLKIFPKKILFYNALFQVTLDATNAVRMSGKTYSWELFSNFGLGYHRSDRQKIMF